MPRSPYNTNHVFKSTNHTLSGTPPWNPSDKIGPDAFLTDKVPGFPGEWEEGDNIVKVRGRSPLPR